MRRLPPIHAESYHVATYKVPVKDGGKFRSIFSDNLQPIATRGKKARDTLLVSKHCRNGCSIKRAPLSVSYYNEISGGHIGSSVVRTRGSAGPVLPLWFCLSVRPNAQWRRQDLLRGGAKLEIMSRGIHGGLQGQVQQLLDD